jgi:hypothetical protein
MTAKRLHDVELSLALDALVRKIEGEHKRPIEEQRLTEADVGPVVAFFDDAGAPHMALSKGATPTVEDVALELARLDLRSGRREKNMPYAEMRHEANRRLCRRLYRIVEQEIILSEVESLGVAVRRRVLERLEASFIEPLRAGNYRKGEADPGRVREGALDALEVVMTDWDDVAARNRLAHLAEIDMAISRPLGLMYKVIENHRPFEGEARVRAAYYLAVPFLFDARKPASPAPR